MTEYSDYPMTLAHPNFQPSKSIPIPGTEIYNGNGEVIRRDYRGTPLLMPPVTVKNEAEEEYYRAQGYERAGKVDPAAWVRAHSDAPPDEYKPVKYPLWRGDQLIRSAAEDPEADPADLEAPASHLPNAIDAPVPIPAATEIENLQNQMSAMNAAMSEMMEMLRAEKAENARLKAAQGAPNPLPEADLDDEVTAAAPKVSAVVEPRQKRAYRKRETA
jgi:hypothetical protein